MNVYTKRFRIPNRFRTSLSSDECKVLEVDGVPFVDEYGAFPPVDELRTDPSGRYLLFNESGIDAFIGIDLMSHHIIEIIDLGQGLHFVNSTLGQYVTSFHIFVAGLPYAYDDTDPDGDSLGVAAQHFRDAIKDIDLKAAEDNSMWSELSWDIANGDWQ